MGRVNCSRYFRTRRAPVPASCAPRWRSRRRASRRPEPLWRGRVVGRARRLPRRLRHARDVGAANLWRFLQQAPAARTRRGLRRRRARSCAACATPARLYPDLNLQNFLIRRAASGIEAWLIDLDGVRFATVTHATAGPPSTASAGRVRKARSESAVITLACVEAFQVVRDRATKTKR